MRASGTGNIVFDCIIVLDDDEAEEGGAGGSVPAAKRARLGR